MKRFKNVKFSILSLIGILFVGSFQNCAPADNTPSVSQSASSCVTSKNCPAAGQTANPANVGTTPPPSIASPTNAGTTPLPSIASPANAGTTTPPQVVTTPPSAPNPSVADETLAIRSATLTSLGREPTTQELQNYLAQLAIASQPRVMLNSIAQTISNSTEAHLCAFYVNLLGRNPDLDGMSFWLAQVAKGESLDSVKHSISTSNEAAIRQMYLHHLNREPEYNGMTFWLAQVSSGQTLGQVENGIRGSIECKVDCSIQ